MMNPIGRSTNQGIYTQNSHKKNIIAILFVSTISALLAFLIKKTYSNSIISQNPCLAKPYCPFLQSWEIPSIYLSEEIALLPSDEQKKILDTQTLEFKKITSFSDFAKEKHKLKKFIYDVYSSDLTENERKTLIGKLLLYIARLQEPEAYEKRKIIVDFFKDTPDSFKEDTSNLMTYFIKNGFIGDFYYLCTYLPLLPFHQAFMTFQRDDHVSKNQKLSDKFYSYLAKCSNEDQQFLNNLVENRFKPKTIENTTLSPSREGAIILRETPKIFLYPGLFDEKDCTLLTKDNTLFDSLIENSLGDIKKSTFRTSQSTSLITPPISHKETVKKLVNLFKTKFNIPEKNIEELNLVFYKGDGQGYFRLHFDAHHYEALKELRQRVATIILYLNTVEDGGSTYFPWGNISVSPKKGSLLFFENIDSNNKVCNEHEGRPLQNEEGKWIVTAHILENFSEDPRIRSSVRNSRTSLPSPLQFDPVEYDTKDYQSFVWT